MKTTSSRRARARGIARPGFLALVLGSALAFLPVTTVPAAVNGGTLERVRVEGGGAGDRALELERDGYDVLRDTVTESAFDLVVSAEELEALRRLGLEPVLVERGRPFAEIQAERMAGEPQVTAAPPPGYPNLGQLVGQMNSVALAHPGICRMVDLTATYGAPPTVNGRHLYALKISDHPDLDEDEPAFLIVADHHAREIVTPVLALYAIDRFTSNYGTDPTITALVNQWEIWIAPTWNPDGYDYVFTVDNYWRKNRHVFPTGIGVDINRNYPQGWTNPCAGSTSPSSDTYKGPSAGSEAETQTMMLWSAAERFAKVMDYHSSGRQVLHGYECWTYPFDSYLASEASAISVAAGYGGDIRGPSADGEHYEWQFATQGAYAFLMETALEFQPSYSQALAEAALVWPSTLWMLQRPLPLWGHVTDSLTGAAVSAAISYLGVTFLNGETNASGGAYGRYHAFLPAGTYNLVFTADGYDTLTVSGVTVSSGSSTRLDVAMNPQVATDVAETSAGEGAFDKLYAPTDPFEPHVRYRIGASGEASLRVYDVRGTLVRTLASGAHGAGTYDVAWDGADDRGARVSPGVYFVRLTTPREAMTRKALLAR